MDFLPVGKLPSTLLRNFLGKIKIADDRVILGPTIGEDVTVIKFNGKLLIAKTDPITFATDLIGWYAVMVNANDIATMGVKPRWFLATILLPERCTSKEVERIFDQILTACDSLRITLVGGHTEVSYGFKRPVVVGCMLAEAENKPIIATSGATPGDDIVITKGIAIEGTALIAREARKSLLESKLSPDLVQRAANFLFSPGISVLEEALIASSKVMVNSMHDPTEGGLSTGLWEIAEAAKVGILVYERKIPILPECKTICDRFALNPLGLLASGALIITLPPPETNKLLPMLVELGINAEVIGKVLPAEEGIRIQTETGTQPLPQFQQDELTKFLGRHGRSNAEENKV